MQTPLLAGTSSTSSIGGDEAWVDTWREQHSPQQAVAAAAAVVVASTNGAPMGAAHGESNGSVPQPDGATPPPSAAGSPGGAVLPTEGGGGGDEAGGRAKSDSNSLRNRVVFGVLLGAAGVAAVLVKQLFVMGAVFVTYHATIEYYAMVTSKGITRGMAPPSTLVSSLTTVICVSMVMFSTIYTGRSGMVLAGASFFLLVMNMVANRRPTFSMLASTLFGVFYCGWLPSFWVKLRWIASAAPDLPVIPLLVSPFSPWTVGILATFTSILCVVAADVGAFVVGKNVGRTKLTDISPKKTVEGAIGGLLSSIGTALLMQRLTSWPATPIGAALLGVSIFFSSLFGDLIESIIKRDAEMKDSGDMIPGHGGLLDRFDSYIFTGPLVYFLIIYVLPFL
ncbi:hypothetical protein FOA52_006347 [Chlamydomonas sp. UWO 241]|nr:hypothetical protein FOA52_006347 [Chlamydomonas sp. UWO 241]